MVWTVEFDPPPMATRLQVYTLLAPICDKLVVAFEEVNRLTTGIERVITTSHRGVAACLLAGPVCDRTSAHSKIAEALSGLIAEFKLDKSTKWDELVDHLTGADVSAEVKDVTWPELNMRFKLWWLIMNENVRSPRSTNARLVAILIRSTSAKAMFSSLLNEYRAQTNRANTLRVDYKLCPSVTDADNEVVSVQPWAEKVLDWFAERLPEQEQNRRSLYLWGCAGVGKSRLISRLLAGRMCFRRDCCEGFFLQDLAEEFEFVWLDEFVPRIMTDHGEYRQQFNKLTGREQLVVRVKYGVQYEVDASNIRTIICSNEAPPSADYFARRLFAVVANEALYDQPSASGSYQSSGRYNKKATSTYVKNAGQPSKRPKQQADSDYVY
jgi:hypothetical protein